MSRIIRLNDPAPLEGEMRIFARPAGSRLWRYDGTFKNILLNQWYLDLFAQLQPSPPGGITIAPTNLALGYWPTPAFARTDTALNGEWTSTVTQLTVASGVVPITSLSVNKLPIPIANGASVTLGVSGTPQVLTVNPGEAAAATSLRVNSFTPNTNRPIGTPITYVDSSIWVPQRMSVVLGTTNASDPVSGTWSFYLPASSNTVSITFTEAGLVYNANTTFMSHVAFAYTKSGNTDLRIDYVLTRTTT